MALKPEQVFAAAPLTQRGKATLLSTDPKGKLLVYPAGISVVMRSVENPIDSRMYTQHTKEVTCARISPSSYYCASGDQEGNVRIWATNNEDLTLKLETRPITGPVKDIAWCGESKRVVVVGDGSERFALPFAFDTGVTTGEIIGHSEVVNTADIKPTRPFRVVTGSDDKSVNFYEGPPFKFKQSFKEHSNYVNCVRYAPDGSKFVSVGSDKKIFVLDGKTGDKLKELPTEHKGSVYQCSFNADGSQMITTSADKTCKLWDMKEDTVLCTFQFPNELQYMQVGGTFAGKQIISLSLNGDLNYLDPANPDQPTRVLRGHCKPITSMVFDNKGSFLYTASATDSCVLRWALDGMAERVTGPGHSSIVTDLCLLDGLVATCGMDDTVRFVEANSLTYADAPAAVAGGPQGVAAVPGQPGVLVVATLKAIAVVRQGAVVASEPVDYTPLCVACSPAGHVAVGGKNKTIHLYTLVGDSLKEFQTLGAPHLGAVQTVRYDAQGGRLASGDANRQIVTWIVGEEYKVDNADLVFHSNAVKAVHFSPSGRYLCSGGVDCMLIVWDLQTGKKVTARAHNNGCNAVQFIAEDRIATAGADAAVRLWAFTP
eukprot:EG_transcript_5130